MAAALADAAAGVLAHVHVHPYGTSAYGELRRGAPGAADIGDAAAVLVEQRGPACCLAGILIVRWERGVYFHEVNVESYHA